MSVGSFVWLSKHKTLRNYNQGLRAHRQERVIANPPTMDDEHMQAFFEEARFFKSRMKIEIERSTFYNPKKSLHKAALARREIELRVLNPNTRQWVTQARVIVERKTLEI